MRLSELLLLFWVWGCAGCVAFGYDSVPGNGTGDGSRRPGDNGASIDGSAADGTGGGPATGKVDGAVNGRTDAGDGCRGCAPDAGDGVTLTCGDGARNGDETDVDCGGAECRPCDFGASCQAGGDCASDLCEKRLCCASDDTTCDGVDDDCDGVIDDDFVPSPTTCGEGACAGNTGKLRCESGVAVDSCDPLEGAAAVDSTCDGVDDDCDGVDDEDFASKASVCGVGACAGNAGVLTCKAGSLQDSCEPMLGSEPEGPPAAGTCRNDVDENCDGLLDDQDPGCPWLSRDWLYRKQITIKASKVSEDLINFPLLVSRNDGSLANHANADASDIVFTKEDGETLLDHEIELFNKESGQLVAWVRIPRLTSNTDTVLYMYYRNQGADDRQNPAGVWNEGYRGVWHLADDPGPGDPGGIRDSSGNSAHGEAQFSMSRDDLVEAQIGNGLAMDGAGDHVAMDIDFEEIPNASRYSFSIWMWTDRPTDLATLMAYSTDEVGFSYVGLGYGLEEGKAFLYHYADDDTVASISSDLSVPNEQWHLVVGTRDRDRFSIYVDGEYEASREVTGLGESSTYFMWLGQNPYNNGEQAFDGRMDEARISAVALSPAWIETEHANQRSPSTFMALSGQQVL